MDQAAAQTFVESQKSSLAFRTISEVSQEIDVPQHVLRFWESRFSQIRPLKRGGGRRYYRPEDVELLRCIKNFLYKQGYTIKGVQRILKEQRSSEAPSLASYRQHTREDDIAADVAQEIPPEDFSQSFEATIAEATVRESEAPAAQDAIARGLSAVEQIHDELQVPVEPMRVESAQSFAQPPLFDKPAESAVEKKANGKITKAAMQAELRDILAELIALRDLLRGASA